LADVGGTNDVSLLKLQLAGAQHRETLATQALSHVRQLSDQLSESLAREQRLSAELSEVKRLLQARQLGEPLAYDQAEAVGQRNDEMRQMREEIASLKATLTETLAALKTKGEQMELLSKENHILRKTVVIAGSEEDEGDAAGDNDDDEGSVYDLADEDVDDEPSQSAEESGEGLSGAAQGLCCLSSCWQVEHAHRGRG
jgi:hypothetical protein